MSGQRNNSTRAESQFNDEFKGRWLAAYRDFGSVSHACAEVQCSRSTIYRLRNADPKFAENWDAAWEATIDQLEQSAMHRAIHGYEEIYLYQGKPVIVDGKPVTKRTYDGRLTEFMLSANRPGKYRSKTADVETSAQDRAREIVNAVEQMRATFGKPPKKESAK